MGKRSLFGTARDFAAHVVPSVIRPLRALWNEVIGFLFLCFTIIAMFQGVRAARRFSGDPASFFEIIVIGLFALVMGSYAISSFRRARKISRS